MYLAIMLIGYYGQNCMGHMESMTEPQVVTLCSESSHGALFGSGLFPPCHLQEKLAPKLVLGQVGEKRKAL